MVPPLLRPLVFGLVGMAIGFVLHDELAPRAAADDAGHATEQRCAFDWLRLRGEMHAVVRDTLITTLRAEAQRAGGLSAVSAAAGDAGAAAVYQVPAATPAQEVALREHTALLDAAQRRGTWSESDVLRSRQLLGAMSAEGRAQALSATAAAINSGRLKVTAARPF